MKTENKLTDVIRLFTSQREYNKNKLGEAVIDGENIVATSGHILVVAPIKYFLTNNHEKITSNFPDYKKVVPEHNRESILFRTDAKFISDEANMLLRKDEYTECERCEGDGYLYTHNQSQVQCDECNCTGHDEYLGNLIPMPSEEYDQVGEKSFLFKVGENYFNPNFLQNITRIGGVLNQPVMEWCVNTPGKGSVIYIDDVMVVVMPLRSIPNKENHLGDLTIIEIPTTVTTTPKHS